MSVDRPQHEGVYHQDVTTLRRQMEGAIEDTVARLKSIEADAQHRLRQATIEQQHLDSFLDELSYRVRTITTGELNEAHMTITGPLTEGQLNAMQAQEGTLKARRGELDNVNSELEQLSSRLTWLIHQIEGAVAWVLSSNGGGNDSGEAEGQQSGGMQPNAGDQVMWAQIIMAQEAERARLAREIHDGPAQALANTVMRLQFVEQLYKKQRGEEAQSEMTRLRRAMQESLRDVRRFIFDLRPASLSDAGLLPTLRHYTQDYSQQFSVPVELNLPESLVLSANQELVVFRIAQEALQNIHKHADATQIAVNVQQRPDGPVVVTVTDNGQGFDPKSVRQNRPSSSGLVNMRERAATAGGTLKVDSIPGTGTTVTLTLPTSKA